MNRNIKIDGLPLTEEENARHRGAYNAALSAMIPKGEPNAFVHSTYTSHAYAFAEATVREYRMIVGHSYPQDDPNATFALVDEDRVIDVWMRTQRDFTHSHNAVIRNRRIGNEPRTVTEIAEAAGVARAVVIDLIESGILVRKYRGRGGG